MEDLTSYIVGELRNHSADLVGVGDLSELPPEARKGLPLGICVAIKYPEEVIQGIADLPTQGYFDWYNLINERLDTLVTTGAEILQANGYSAIAQTREQVGQHSEDYRTLLPHKTVATRAGLGWIGKSALLVSEQYGSMIRLSSILTNAPLEVAEPVNQSRCGDCLICTDVCPAGAISGKAWEVGLSREDFFDATNCCMMAQERSKQGFGGEATICGKCIEICPHTRKAWKHLS